MRIYAQNTINITARDRKQLLKVKIFYFDWFLNTLLNIMPVSLNGGNLVPQTLGNAMESYSFPRKLGWRLEREAHLSSSTARGPQLLDSKWHRHVSAGDRSETRGIRHGHQMEQGRYCKDSRQTKCKGCKDNYRKGNQYFTQMLFRAFL